MSLTSLKIAEAFLAKAKETYEHQMQMLPLVMFEEPDGGNMQNAGNVIWRPVQQHAHIQSGWDLTGQEDGIIEESYPSILGTPKSDLVQQRADNMRDMRYWERRAEQSGLQQATELNLTIAQAIALQGSLFYRSNVDSGYGFISLAQAMMNERQTVNNGRAFIVNDRDLITFAADLAGRQTTQGGRPEQAWATSQIGNNVAGFDIFTGSFLPNLVGGASPGATVTGAQSFAPEAGSVDTATGIVTNVDYRSADIPVSTSGSYNVGDKVTIGAVQSVGLADKQATGQLMTFTIVAKPDATTITVYPKPIAYVDPALTDLEKQYANINVVIPNAAVVARLNTAASEKTNLFFDKGAIEVLGGNIPAELFANFAGFKVLTDTLSNGLKMYFVYDGDLATMNFRFRCFTWSGITVANPQACGTALHY